MLQVLMAAPQAVLVHAQEMVTADKTSFEMCVTFEQPKIASSPSMSASRCR